jgi:hypothetical protein
MSSASIAAYRPGGQIRQISCRPKEREPPGLKPAQRSLPDKGTPVVRRARKARDLRSGDSPATEGDDANFEPQPLPRLGVGCATDRPSRGRLHVVCTGRRSNSLRCLPADRPRHRRRGSHADAPQVARQARIRRHWQTGTRRWTRRPTGARQQADGPAADRPAPHTGDPGTLLPRRISASEGRTTHFLRGDVSHLHRIADNQRITGARCTGAR